jgi:hypothetical protein
LCDLRWEKLFSRKRIFNNNGFDTFYERLFEVGKGKTSSNGKHLNLLGANIGYPVGRWFRLEISQSVAYKADARQEERRQRCEVDSRVVVQEYAHTNMS